MKILLTICLLAPFLNVAQNLVPCQSLKAHSTYWGYCDDDHVVIEQNYGSAYPFIEGLAVVQNWQGKFDIIDSKGGLVSDIAYDDFYRIDNGGFILKKDLKWHFYDKDLSPILTEYSIEYAVIEKFRNKHVHAFADRTIDSETVVSAKKDDLFGAINLKGEEQIEFKFDFLRNYGTLSTTKDQFITIKKGKLLLINEDGGRIAKFSSEGFVGEMDSLFYFYKEGELIAIDEDGNKISFKEEERFGDLLHNADDHIVMLGNNDKKLVISNFNDAERNFLQEAFLNEKSENFKCISSGKLGLTNGLLEEVLPCKYDDIEPEEIAKQKVYVLSTKAYLTIAVEENRTLKHYGDAKNKFTRKYYKKDGYYDNLNGLVDSIGNVLSYTNNTWVQESRYKETIITKGRHSKLGLVKGGKRITPFVYNGIRMEGYKQEVFIASTDSGNVCLSFEGKLLYPYAFNILWACVANEGYYVSEKDDLYGIFSEDGVVNMPMVKIKNPWVDFNIDNAVYNSIQGEYIVEKDGKLGVMSTKGEFRLKPIYDHISIEEMYDEYGDIFEYTFVSQDGRWFILDDFGNEFKTLDIDTWYGKQRVRTAKSSYANEFYMGTKNGEPRYYDFGFNLINKFNLDIDMAVIGKYGEQGLIDGSGRIVAPLTYRSIDKSNFDELEIFYLKTIDRKMGLMTIKGEVILEAIYDKINIICYQSSFFLVYKDRLGALASFDSLKTKFNFISDFIYSNSSCHSLDKSQPLCKVSLNGKRVFLYQDGRTEEIKK